MEPCLEVHEGLQNYDRTLSQNITHLKINYSYILANLDNKYILKNEKWNKLWNKLKLVMSNTNYWKTHNFITFKVTLGRSNNLLGTSELQKITGVHSLPKINETESNNNKHDCCYQMNKQDSMQYKNKHVQIYHAQGRLYLLV